MVKIRLQRLGAKNKPYYAIVATIGENKRDGKFFEKLGTYYPKAKLAKDKIVIDQQKLEAWKAKGAQMSLTVQQIVTAAAQ